MTSFGWKRKTGANVSKLTSTSFEENTKDDDEEVRSGDIDWISLAPKRRIISLEDALGKSERLKNEGCVLAESDRYWEAIKKWDEALHFNPLNCKVYEMKAQALMALNELYPAVSAARKTVEVCPTWWVGHQTLGRAQLNLGEVRLALHSFSTAVHLNPADRDLWEEDLMWADSLMQQHKQAVETVKQQANKSTVTITEISDDPSPVCDRDQAMDKCDTGAGGEGMSVKAYSRETADKIKRTGKLKSVPNNYVIMRDK
ncbi:tetratricopeptide repeat protein 33-like [Haliotis rubra]|uniref:tetratricopeptide repeat protein 33-like n=1 Tax=Haliotis rubra TaxID=36100 RepID=UPI001EE62DB5|nr:tetratricopeptide repeat protein 33-like [Haliotis rubra]XP_046548555.1 tetratricopeptide repeat protein 33-like [Haliotis rubra]XP_046548557.1 tetratricopeptide repeat protein 33-like [Haliotis rubra]XP_046548558.1 tetratricopeptide repeat protein 33-like [Haliotis rubra]